MQLQIQQQRRSAEEAELRRLSALQNRQQTQSHFNTVQRRFQELTSTQQNILRSLDISINLINQTENKLSNIHDSIEKIMFYLLIEDMANSKLQLNKKNDAFLLSFYLKKLLDENRKLISEMNSISREREMRQREFNETQSRSRQEQNRLNTISTDLKQIDSDIVNFQRQREEYQENATRLEIAAAELQDLLNLLKTQTQRYIENFEFPTGIETPIHGRIITHFGPRYNDRYNVSTISNGIDIAAPENSLVRAFADGEVVFADVFSGSGRLIIIDHKNGYHTVYGYNNELLVRVGENVNRGQVIARSGSTGAASQPALHFEIRRANLPVNPLEYIIP